MKVTEPRIYQSEDVRKVEEFGGRALIAGEMGIGKSLEALLYCLDHPNLRPIVVVCPKSLKWNWAKEARIHIGMKSVILDGSKPSGRIPHGELYIINYDILGPRKKKKFGYAEGGWLDFFKMLKPKIIIGDEIQYIKAISGVGRVKSFKKLCEKVPHILALSGTPLVNKPVELWNIVNLLCPKVFGSKRKYLDQFCEPTFTRWGVQYNGATNLDILNSMLLKNCMVRRLKRDILTELPPKSRFVVPLPIERPQEYKKAEKDFVNWLKEQPRTNNQKKKRTLNALVKLGYVKRLAASLKLKSVMEWVDNFLENSSEKLVLFCIHKNILSALYNKYKNLAVFIAGGVSDADRQKAVENFQTKKWCRLFIGNIQAAGVGITLVASSTVAFPELDWVPANMTQCEDRIHRIGQMSDKAQIFYLVAHNTIEEKLCEVLQNKQKILDAVLDGQTGGVSTLDIFDELERELNRGF